MLIEVAMLLDLASLSTPPPSPLLQETGKYIRPGLWFRVFWNSGICSFMLGQESLSKLGFVSEKTTNPFKGQIVRIWPMVFVVFFTFVPRCVSGLKIFWSIIDQERDWSNEKYEKSEITSVQWQISCCLKFVIVFHIGCGKLHHRFPTV